MQAHVGEHWPHGREASQMTIVIHCDECCGPGKSKGLREHREEWLTQLRGFIEVLGHELNCKG